MPQHKVLKLFFLCVLTERVSYLVELAPAHNRALFSVPQAGVLFSCRQTHGTQVVAGKQSMQITHM